MPAITFGKYKNNSIKDIFSIDRYYIYWLRKQKWFKKYHNQLYQETNREIHNYNPDKYYNKFLVYTDGSCSNNGNPGALSSIGVHFSDKNIININDISEKIIRKNHSNNCAELFAIKRSLEVIKENNIKLPVEIYTDSSYSRSILVEWYDKWVKNGLLNNKKNIKLIEKTYKLYKSFDDINIYYVKAHTKKVDEHSYGNRIADKLARSAY